MDTMKVIDEIKGLPLIDLHCHLDGSITVPIAKELARIQDIKLPTNDDKKLMDLLSIPNDCESLNQFLECFALPCSLMQTRKGITECIRLVQDNIMSHGVVYLELRFAPQKHCDNGLTQRDVIYAALDGLKKSKLHTNLILCMMRGNDEATRKANMETVELAKELLVEDGGVVAIDIAGAEALFKTKDFKEEFELAKKLNIPFTIHAGEADGPDSVECALNYGAKRIGHGVRSWQDKKLVDRIIKDEIVLELCPNSNRQTCSVPDMSKYPFRSMYEKGVKTTVNTDDMAICRTTLPDEFAYLENLYKFSREDFKQMLRNSVFRAFTSKKVKDELYKKIDEA